MNRPDIHDIRNRHLAETIEKEITSLGAFPQLSYELKVEFIKAVINNHLTEMGLCLLDENGD